jgi:hypothetical protein
MRRNPQEGKRKQKEKTSLQERRKKTSLTLTGLLMEGVEESSSGEGPTSERQRATLATNDFIQAQGDPCRIHRRMVPKTYLS